MASLVKIGSATLSVVLSDICYRNKVNTVLHDCPEWLCHKIKYLLFNIIYITLYDFISHKVSLSNLSETKYSTMRNIKPPYSKINLGCSYDRH